MHNRRELPINSSEHTAHVQYDLPTFASTFIREFGSRRDQRLRYGLALFSPSTRAIEELLKKSPERTILVNLPGGGQALVTEDYQVNHQVTMPGSGFERAEFQQAAGAFAGKLLTQEGDEYLRSRRLISAPLARSVVPNHIPTMMRVSEEEFSKLSQKAESAKRKSERRSISLHDTMMDTVGRISLESLIGGVQVPSDLVEHVASVTMNGLPIEGFKMFAPRLIGENIARRVHLPGTAAYEKTFAITKQQIRELLHQPIPEGNILSAFQEAIAEGVMSEDEAIVEFLGVFAASYETTATNALWAAAHLANDPELYHQAKEEADHVLGDSSLTPQQQVAALPIARAIAAEAARLYPPAARQMRQASEDNTPLVIHGQTVLLPKGLNVITFVHRMQRDPRVWGNDANEFNIAHTTDERLSQVMREYPGAYAPFTEGKHRCAGENFALLEMPILIAELVRHLSLEQLKQLVGPGMPKMVFKTALSPSIR